MAHKAPTHRPPFWKPAPKNPNPEHSFYKTAAWAGPNGVRQRVLKRDGYQCTDPHCTTPGRGRGQRLTAHHTRGREGAFALDDQWIVTLCQSCHNKVHGNRSA